MLQTSFSLPWSEKCPNNEAKGLLKGILSKKVPRNLVYRKKSGFAPPVKQIFALRSVQEFLRDVVLSNTNPLIDFLRVQEVKKMIELAFRGQQLSFDVYSFLWCLIFTTAWLDQCKFSQKSFILDRCSRSDVSPGPPSSY